MVTVAASDRGRVIWVPVRHHSPAAARAVRALVERHRPEAVLIEGPSEFTAFDQLALDHRLPIAIMTWLRYVADGRERQSHALYPLTVFSAEWQALVAAREFGARAAFIDLPWADQFALTVALADDDAAPRPGEEEAAPSLPQIEPGPGFFETLALRVGREDSSAVWDEFFEIDPDLDPDTYLVRAATLGEGVRLSAAHADEPETRAREAFMARRIAETLADTAGPVLVVTGAFHTAGLQALLAGRIPPSPGPAPIALPGLVAGTALVPTSYETLDAHRGYLAGQPSPGFYHRVFEATPTREASTVSDLFTEAIAALRARRVAVSPADAIAAMTTAKALAQMRGHARLWRDDLVDGITGAVVKDDLDEDHPLLRVVLTSLRGDRIGRLAEGADVPPLVQEVRRRWADQELPFSRTVSPLTLALDHAADRATSQLLHGLRVVGVPAAVPPAAPTGPLTARARIDGSERWALVWNQDVETALIHASRWGGSLEQAVTAVLEHRARLGTATTLAAVLTDAVRAGLEDVSGRLGAALRDVLARSDDLGELGVVLESLVRLVHFDTWLGAVGRSDLADLTRFAHERTTSVLERLAPMAEGPHIPAAVAALRTLAETTATLASALDLDVDAVAGALERQTERPPGSPGHDAEFEGALIAAGWLLSGDPGAALEARMSDPAQTGRFYSGLLAVAGHLAIAAPQIFTAADDALRFWDDDAFLAALPDLRRAMHALSSRERASLLAHLTGDDAAPAPLIADDTALVVLSRREARVWDAVATWTGTQP